VPGYLRGIAFTGSFAVGLSQPRAETFGDLELAKH
jgi:hypothetical protein